MKKLLTVTLALSMTLSLAACGGEQPPQSPASGSGGSEPPQSSHSQENAVSQSGDAGSGVDDFVKYTPAVEKLYISTDVLVFELTDPSVGEFIRKTEAGEEMSIFFSLPQFEAELRMTAGDESYSASYSNSKNGNSAASNQNSIDRKLRWSLHDNTVQLACLAHGYDITTLVGTPVGYADMQVRASGSNSIYMGGGPLEKIEIITQVPEEFTRSVEIPNPYSTSDFDLFKYASPKTDDYYLQEDDPGSLRVVSFDEKGFAIYLEDIHIQENIDPNGEWENSDGGVKYHASNRNISISWNTTKSMISQLSKEKTVNEYLGHGVVPHYIEYPKKIYFSKPTLYPSQMGMDD